MGRIAPRLGACSPRSADVFARTRILALRAVDRGGRDGISVVAVADVAGSPRSVRDLAWWPSATAEGATDPGLRADLAARMLVGTGRAVAAAPACGLVAVRTREGPAEELVDDRAWSRAFAHAAQVVGVPVPRLLVVTRWGWRTEPDGDHRTWTRLRDRR